MVFRDYPLSTASYSRDGGDLCRWQEGDRGPGRRGGGGWRTGPGRTYAFLTRRQVESAGLMSVDALRIVRHS
ncbi:protein of unknown function [Streptantibioticus cattleyicolor NRRL 8057 = DSM 46488]|nr:protein of unknown function [Streptantibioticus cattleyicolor NRRL 8057 = DSM 46488]